MSDFNRTPMVLIIEYVVVPISSNVVYFPDPLGRKQNIQFDASMALPRGN